MNMSYKGSTGTSMTFHNPAYERKVRKSIEEKEKREFRKYQIRKRNVFKYVDKTLDGREYRLGLRKSLSLDAQMWKFTFEERIARGKVEFSEILKAEGIIHYMYRGVPIILSGYLEPHEKSKLRLYDYGFTKLPTK